MIIDVHAHLGWDCVFDEDFTISELLEKHTKHNISKTILQPGTCHDIDTVKKQHNDIAAVMKEFPGHFVGMANPNPHLESAVYETELVRCLKELNFVGIKMHTFAHATNPCGKDGKNVFRMAAKYNVPVMVHTGTGIPFSNPCNLIPVAEEFPNVKIIMAHCGMMVLAAEVPNKYLHVSYQ